MGDPKVHLDSTSSKDSGNVSFINLDKQNGRYDFSKVYAIFMSKINIK